MALGDSLLVLVGLLLIVMGIQPMFQDSVQQDSVRIANSLTLIVMGIFIIFYWNTIVP